MLGLWLDYSQGRPSAASVKATGAVGVMRYVGIGGSAALPAKRLTASELADLDAHGLLVLGAVESTTTRSNGGRSLGIEDGRAALADPVTRTLPVLFATNDQSGWSSANVAYVAGFQSVVGPERTGVYGFGSFLAACANDGLGSTYWQAGPSPSRTGTSGLAHFWQRNGTAGATSDGPATPTSRLVAGVSCDLNNQLREMTDVALTDADAQLVANKVWTMLFTDPSIKGGMMGWLLLHNQQRLDNADFGLEALGAKSDALKMQVLAASGAETQGFSNIMAAIKTQTPGAPADIAALASAIVADLAPHMPPEATPEQIAAAFLVALRAQMSK